MIPILSDKKPGIYFLGSGQIGIESLSVLHSSDCVRLLGAGTQPDRPSGRKRLMSPTPVGQWADEHSLELDKPVSVNAPDFLDKLRSLAPDIIFVVSFGQILKREILELPGTACVNLHASLLPKYRGASPIAASLLNGDKVTGVTFMKMDEGLDTGPEYCCYEYRIGTERADELETALGCLAAAHIEEVLLNVCFGELIEKQQDDSKATYAGKIRKSDGRIDWNEPAEVILRKIRAYHPWPGAFFFYKLPNGREMKINVTDAAVQSGGTGSEPGATVFADKNGWGIAAGEGTLMIKLLKPEGKSEMTSAEFVRGRQELRAAT